MLTGTAAVPFAKGYRFGEGPVLAVVRPGSLLEMWRVLRLCVAADVIVIAQAANTGLTGGSTPNGEYDRPVVVISTSRISKVLPIDDARQVVCLAGTTLYDLERTLGPLGREPHSVIGSSCIGASVIGGVCNNSGGALVRRGPAYTEYALYAAIDADGRLRLHNNLGMPLGDDPEAILRRLDHGALPPDGAIAHDRTASAAKAYEPIVRDVDADTPARFNADPARLFEVSGSAGKVVVFAVRLDTFPKDERSAVYYIGTNDPDELTQLRRRLLADAPVLPVSGEYIHRDAFDLADRYGKDTVAAIRLLGTERLPLLFRLKGWVDGMAAKLRFLPDAVSDRLLQGAGRLLPDQLPARMRAFRDRYEHHLILKVADGGVEHAAALLAATFPTAAGDWFACDAAEANAAMLHRFAVAGAAVRYRAVHADEVEDILALDVALPRGERAWVEELPGELVDAFVERIYYGHFMCHVFHQDYLVKKGRDPVALEHQLLKLMDARGARYPAEHNVGHLYPADPELREHYRSLDPTNSFNPGVGGCSRERNWA